MHRLQKLLRSRRGYVMLVVLCVLLVFSVMGINVLAAAFAGTGTAAKKKSSSQAYLLASSALPNVARMVEDGAFDDFIAGNLIDPAREYHDSGDESDVESLDVDVSANVPKCEGAKLTLQMSLRDVTFQQYQKADSFYSTMVLATLTVRVTAEYQEEKYSLLMDFSQLPDSETSSGDDNPENPQPPEPDQPTKWLLRSYRTARSVGD